MLNYSPFFYILPTPTSDLLARELLTWRLSIFLHGRNHWRTGGYRCGSFNEIVKLSFAGLAKLL
jgi:hypothetical protein